MARRSIWCRWFGLGCPKPPMPPSFRTVAFSFFDSESKPINGVVIKVDGIGQGQTNIDGYLGFTRVPANFPESHLWAIHPEWLPYEQHLDVPSGDVDFIIGDSGRPLGQKQVQLPSMVRPIPDMPTLQPYNRWWQERESGKPVPLRGASFFVGLRRHMLGEDTRPAMRYAREVGASNMLRVFTGMELVPTALGLGTLKPWDALRHLDDFLFVAQEERMYVLLTAGDFQVLMPDKAEQRDYFARLATIASQHTNVVGFGPNEPWKNGIDPFDFATDAYPGLIYFSRGSAAGESTGYEPRLDFYEKHDDRSLAEGGWKWVRHQWELKWMAPLSQSEPMGAAEMQIDGRRDNSPARFATAALVGEVVGGGWVLHSDYGIAATVPTHQSTENLITYEVGSARRRLPPEVVTWQQTRTGLHDSVLELDDLNTLRVFMRIGPSQAYAVAVRPTSQYEPKARLGWTVVDYKAPIVYLERR